MAGTQRLRIDAGLGDVLPIVRSTFRHFCGCDLDLSGTGAADTCSLIMQFAAGINKDFLLTAEGAEAQAGRASNRETKATFIMLARAYRQLAEEVGNHRSGFPSGHPRSTSLRLPRIWLSASFGGVPSNDTQFGLIQDFDIPNGRTSSQFRNASLHR